MRRKVLRVVLCVFFVFIIVGSYNGYKNHMANEKEVYAIITKSGGNSFNERQVRGFVQSIESAGYSAQVGYPETTKAEDQIKLVNGFISKKVDAIAIASNDYDALQDVLEKAMEEGIQVIAYDSNVNPESRMVFVNQVGTEAIGTALMEGVYDIAEGDGQWAILSTTAQADNQNAWIESMKQCMENDKFGNLKLVDITYGEDDFVISKEKTLELLEKYPDLKVICSPTTVGMKAAAKVLEDEQSDCKLTGLGLPSEMANFIGEDEVCPYMYLWNPIEVGCVSAYSLMAIEHGEISGKVDEVFTAGELGQYMIQEASDGGTEIIVGPPLKLDQYNINDWKKEF